MLRLIRVLSAQIAAAVTTAYIDACNIFALVIQFLTSFHTIYVIINSELAYGAARNTSLLLLTQKVIVESPLVFSKE